jgi:hypothetical protein
MLTDTAVMALLDKGSNPLGALSPEVRARLFAVIDNPTQQTWDDAHSIILSGGSWLTLWQAVLRFTDYDVTSRPLDDPWPAVPTCEQIATAIAVALED